ncbi:unnamed protein product [Penicillium viridicatum]
MDGARISPHNFPQIYTQACETFTHKLQCQVFSLLSPSPSPDMEEMSIRLEELCERVIQIGFLGEVGGFGIRDDNRVRIRWDELDTGDAAPLLVADILVDILDNLPF